MSSFTLKILAIISMTLDHIGFILYPQLQILRNFGRLAFPIFAFQIGNGFTHTKSKEKYILRMIIFTIVSQIPFLLFRKTASPAINPTLNIGATLSCGLLALYALEKNNISWYKYIVTFFIILLSAFIPMDYGFYGVLTIVIFYIFRNNKFLSGFFYFINLALYCASGGATSNIYAIFALIPIFLYNNKKGRNAKYIFYIFYPLHMLILTYLHYVIK